MVLVAAVRPVAVVLAARSAVALAVAVAVAGLAAIARGLAVAVLTVPEVVAVAWRGLLPGALACGLAVPGDEVLTDECIGSFRSGGEGISRRLSHLVPAPTPPATPPAPAPLALDRILGTARVRFVAFVRVLRFAGAALQTARGLRRFALRHVPVGLMARCVLFAHPATAVFVRHWCWAFRLRRGGLQRGRSPFRCSCLSAAASPAATANLAFCLDRGIDGGHFGLPGCRGCGLGRCVGGAAATAGTPSGCRLPSRDLRLRFPAASGSWIRIEDACPKVAHGCGRAR